MADEQKQHAEYLVELGKKLAPISVGEVNGRNYTRQDLKPIYEPLKTALGISTLSSLADLCTSKFKGFDDSEVPAGSKARGFERFDQDRHVVHVIDEKQVQVVSASSNEWAQREVLIDCKLVETMNFPLNRFLNQEEFIIALLSCCVASEDRDHIAKLAGNATAEIVTTAVDDGVSQRMGLRSGASLADKATVKNIVKMRLYRTFREIEQPESTFLFRLEQAKEQVLPKFAFFEADGGAWKLKAREEIARYLRVKLGPDAKVAS